MRICKLQNVNKVCSTPDRENKQILVAQNSMSDSFNKVETNAPAGKSFLVRVLRQDGPGRRPYWERHRVAYEPNMNCISVLQKIAEGAVTVEGKPVAPVAGSAIAWRRCAGRAR